MKILPVPLIREADAFTIAREPIADIDLMERAAGKCFQWLKETLPAGSNLKIFCGPGNNGGDGFALARMLSDHGFQVIVYFLEPPEKMSESCRTNYLRMQKCRNEEMQKCMAMVIPETLPVIDAHDFLIDAIFGSGLTRPVSGFPAVLIDHLNASGATIISIDVPSGLFCDATTSPPSGGAVVHATHTLTFAPPKLAFFFPENDENVGNWHLLDIGLSKEFIGSAVVDNFMVEAYDVAPMLRTRRKFDHKGNFGHALLIAGSTGKMGAAVLAARACLRAGTGLLTCVVPRSGISILQTAVPEAMAVPDSSEDLISALPDLDGFTAIGVGPGTGTSPETSNALMLLIQQTTHPIVFDADAINILSGNRTWLAFLPKSSILTPHPKEFERLAGKSTDNFDRHRLQREFSARYQCFVVLKGAHTVTTTPDGRSFFNMTGNPGMATGGSGDVLTGILTGLMAQGYSSLEACLLGIYVHGMAGDIALNEQGYEALIAGDLITYLGKSFQTLYGKF